jgi:hypothetical protein
MSFRQKTALVSLIALLIMYGWYFTEVIGQRVSGAHVGMIAGMHMFVAAIVGVVIIQVVGTVGIIVFSGERQQPMDERERTISARSQMYAYWVLVIGALLVPLSMHAGAHSHDMGNLAVAAVVVAEITRYASYLLLHRRAG